MGEEDAVQAFLAAQADFARAAVDEARPLSERLSAIESFMLVVEKVVWFPAVRRQRCFNEDIAAAKRFWNTLTSIGLERIMRALNMNIPDGLFPSGSGGAQVRREDPGELRKIGALINRRGPWLVSEGWSKGRSLADPDHFGPLMRVNILPELQL